MKDTCDLTFEECYDYLKEMMTPNMRPEERDEYVMDRIEEA